MQSFLFINNMIVLVIARILEVSGKIVHEMETCARMHKLKDSTDFLNALNACFFLYIGKN